MDDGNVPSRAGSKPAAAGSGGEQDPTLFLTTRWSIVRAAGKQHSPESDGALAWLCENYWYPLYAYARRKGNAPEAAEDLVQGFFEQVLERKMFQEMSNEAGRFRAFMLKCFDHFCTSLWIRSKRLKRGGGVPAMAIEEAQAEQRYQRDLQTTTTPERDFDRAWALTLLQRVLTRLQAECDLGREGRFRLIQPFLQNDGLGPSYDVAAAELGIGVNTLRVTVHRMRQRFRQMVVDEISQTVATPEEVGDELQYLFKSLGGT
jgi:DNA-directed RNA polymerase specialized sigma24 family protein